MLQNPRDDFSDSLVLQKIQTLRNSPLHLAL